MRGKPDPTQSDTDGDGYDDSVERYLGSDPQDVASKPPTAIYRVEYPTFAPGVARYGEGMGVHRHRGGRSH